MKTQTSIQILIDGRSSTPQLSGISRYIIELTKGYAKQYGEKPVGWEYTISALQSVI